MPTVQARVTRAKKTLAAAGVPFEIPPPEERPARLGRVLNVVYLVFTEGSSATGGDAWIRTDLAEEALRLARSLARLLPGEPEVLGLLALLELTAIAECHAVAPSVADTDWDRIVVLYEALGRVAPSPVVELNRAVAVAMASGPAAGLALVEQLSGEGVLAGSYLLPSVRGELLARLGRHREAREAFRQAAELCGNAAERAVLLEKAAAAGDRS